MATTSFTGGGGNTRYLSIGREGFSKTGNPVFREWLRNGLPPEGQQKGRRFEERGGHYYENFGAVSGILIEFGHFQKKVKYEGVEAEEKWLYVELEDAGEKYRIELGNFYGRYALNLMARLCNEEFNPNEAVRLSPYSFMPEGEKLKMGINVTQGVDFKIKARQREAEYFEIPAAIENKYMKNGKPVRDLDFTPVGNWLYDFLERNVKKHLLQPEARMSFSSPVTTGNYGTTEKEPPINTDDSDLPF